MDCACRGNAARHPRQSLVTLQGAGVSASWEPFDPEGRPIRGEVLYDLRVDPGWLRGRLVMALGLMTVAPIAATVVSGETSATALIVCGAAVVALDVIYAAWWRRALSRTRLRITTAEVVLEGARRGAVRVPVAAVGTINVLPRSGGDGPFGAYAAITVYRDTGGARRVAKILLPTGTIWRTRDDVDAALDQAQAPLECDERRRA
jgi:hypothetical protein